MCVLLKLSHPVVLGSIEMTSGPSLISSWTILLPWFLRVSILYKMDRPLPGEVRRRRSSGSLLGEFIFQCTAEEQMWQELGASVAGGVPAWWGKVKSKQQCKRELQLGILLHLGARSPLSSGPHLVLCSPLFSRAHWRQTGGRRPVSRKRLPSPLTWTRDTGLDDGESRDEPTH